MSVNILTGDALAMLRTLPDAIVNCVVTSPPYWGLRDYGCAGQIGLEPTPEEYTAKLVAVFAEARRVLTDDGTLWLNIGDTYAAGGNGGNPIESPHYRKCGNNTMSAGLARKAPPGLKPKDLVGIPWRVAFALQADGWYLRQDIIWHKPNPMPESVTDRCTKAHEYVFLLAKSERYYFDAKAIAEQAVYADGCNGSAFDGERDLTVHPNVSRKPRQWPAIGQGTYAARVEVASGGDGHHMNAKVTRNRRSVWTIATQPCAAAHFAVMPEAMVLPCILAGCPVGGTVLDPFGGSGTVGKVAEENGRNSVLIELNPEYVKIAARRTAQRGLLQEAGA